MNKKVILMILDGWGIAPNKKVSAIDNAKTPFIDSLYTKFPHASLRTDGLHVGLPEGQMGNSEVGHMNLGAGRVVYQDLAKINLALKDGSLGEKKALLDAIGYAKEHNKPIHLLGLLSDGGVHSHIEHLYGLIDALEQKGVDKLYVHAFTDGRDVDPRSGLGFVNDFIEYNKDNHCKLASITGRYFAMDRDHRWERITKAYNAIVKGEGFLTEDPSTAMADSYAHDITDEFIEPIVISDGHRPIATIKDGDVVIFFNFRTDRGRELTEALSQSDFPEYGMRKLDLYYVTKTRYDKNFKNINVIFDKDNLKDTLGEVLSKEGKKQLRMAETEKYPHVTFFFSGGQEEQFEGESRILKNSPKVATYDLKPEMSAYEIKDALVNELNQGEQDFICINFANGDMVGHTGVMEAAIKACEAVDICVMEVIETALENDYSTIIIADHGNCETMINPDGTPHTAHTTNPVPIILVDKELSHIKSGILGDIAPTILKLMGLAQPEAMSGSSLI